MNFFLILLFLILLFDRKPNSAALSIDIPLLLFLFIWIASFAHTLAYPPGIWKYPVAVDFKRLISLPLAYFVSSRCIKTKKELNFVFFMILLSLGLVALHTWKSGMLAGPHYADFKRSSGPFGEGFKGADIAGGFLAIFTPFLLSYSIFTKKRIEKIAGFLGLGICIMALFATYSRGSIAALLIAVLIMILSSLKHFFKTSKISTMIILITFIGLGLTWERWVPQSIIHRIEGTTAQEESYGGELPLDESSQGRIKKWEVGIEVFRMNPIFGVGFKIPEFVLKSDTHNSFIQIAAEMGIFGFLVFLLFLLSIFIKTKSLLKTEYVWLGVGFIGCLIAFIIVNMFYSNFFRDTVVGTFWVLLGLLVSAKKLSEANEDISYGAHRAT
ncbi:MAG: O-antigen ligase family protein [Candidatus Omnitrophota bacterium]